MSEELRQNSTDELLRNEEALGKAKGRGIPSSRTFSTRVPANCGRLPGRESWESSTEHSRNSWDIQQEGGGIDWGVLTPPQWQRG